ncbi:hypothetical protein Cgig2_011591 [Carnegiea gigantea]|uniref:Uncharacterized protein n=1 Tax=Carnegiea gigantea TaxID=171969 RepID=A0A9Q1JSA4_9CARY|nr:hypothetical protein Cgig2_011591 [Carnegiea gigantea]
MKLAFQLMIWSGLEKFLPLNKDLIDHNKYPAIVVELLCIYAVLWEFHKVKHIYCDFWLDHFYREYLVYFAYGEQTGSKKGKFEAKKRSSVCIFHQERMTYLSVTTDAFWLSHFVLPYGKEAVRPRTFVMVALMASRHQINLASTVLGYIYHSLGEVASHPDHPNKANAIFFSHYLIVCLAKLFPCLYHRCPDSDCPSGFSTLVHYAGLLGSKLSLSQATHIFRDGRYLSLRANSYFEDYNNGRDVIDMGYRMRILNFFCLFGPLYFLYVVEPNYFGSPITPNDLLANLDSIKRFHLIV